MPSYEAFTEYFYRNWPLREKGQVKWPPSLLSLCVGTALGIHVDGLGDFTVLLHS